MHNHPDHVGGHAHEHTHSHTHEHTHDGVTHTHEHHHCHDHGHTHPHEHEQLHGHGHAHSHDHGCESGCGACCGQCEHSPLEELAALMKYMVSHNAAHARELAELAGRLDQAGQRMAYEQVMAAVSDFEKGNLRLSVVLQSLDVQ